MRLVFSRCDVLYIANKVAREPQQPVAVKLTTRLLSPPSDLVWHHTTGDTTTTVTANIPPVTNSDYSMENIDRHKAGQTGYTKLSRDVG